MAVLNKFDIVVYGSTSGAVATAIQAARLGRSVALVSPSRHIGKLTATVNSEKKGKVEHN